MTAGYRYPFMLLFMSLLTGINGNSVYAVVQAMKRYFSNLRLQRQSDG
jgi:hypothetical protein